jgi:fatty-acid peroxygenase
MLRRVICGRGEDAARMFWTSDRFTRRGTVPANILRLLQDRCRVAALGGTAHRHRKAL